MFRSWFFIFCFISICFLSGCVQKEHSSTKSAQEPVAFSKPPIKIGLLYSLTGPSAVTEKWLVEAAVFTIAEINSQGGLLGRPLKAVVADGKSDPATFAREAERLILQDQVMCIFGTWTSDSRIAVKSVIQKYRNLLFYAAPYEGGEKSSNIVYLGPVPNQQIYPAIDWMSHNIGQRFYIIGSKDRFAEASIPLIRRYLKKSGFPLAGISNCDSDPAIRQALTTAKNAHANVIINLLDGDLAVSFLEAFSAMRFKDIRIASLSCRIGESEVLAARSDVSGRQYVSAGYFMTIPSDANKQLIHHFQKTFGRKQMIGAPMEAIYNGIYLLAKTINFTDSIQSDLIGKAILGQTYYTPQGVVGIDPATRHLAQSIRLGRLTEDARFEIVWSSETPIIALPFKLDSSHK